MSMSTLDAVAAVRRGDAVRVTVGSSPDDPVLRVWAEDGCVMSAGIAGWSAGCVEPVCALDSDFLAFYLRTTDARRVDPVIPS